MSSNAAHSGGEPSNKAREEHLSTGEVDTEGKEAGPVKDIKHDQPAPKDNLEIYETFRSYIRHEDNLTNNRITWMLTIHGFLYASYGFTLQKKLEILDKVNTFVIKEKITFAEYLTESDFWLAIWEIELFLILIAVIGAYISAYGSQSVQAAKHAISSTRFIFELRFPPFPIRRKTKVITVVSQEEVDKTPQRQKGKEFVERVVDIGCGGHQILLPTIAGGGNPSVIKQGQLASIVIPGVLLISWILAVLSSILYLAWNFLRL
jgi:hypothetical protein